MLGLVVMIQLMLMGTNALAQNKYAIDFTGNDYIYLNDESNHLDVSANWTFECWINVDAQTGLDHIMYRTSVFNFSINTKNTGTGDFRVYFWNIDNGNNIGTGDNENLSFNTWYHVAATYDGTTARFFVDGTEVDNSTATWSLASSSARVYIAEVSGGGNYFNGQIDEIRMSKTARTTSEMQTSTHEEEYISDANTVFLMHFDDQNTTPSYISGVGYTGTVGDNILVEDYKYGEIASAKLLRPSYRSKATGNWNTAASWQYDNTGASNWVDAALTPSFYDDAITILNGHTITVSAAVEIDQTTIASGGKVTVSDGNALTIKDGTGTDLSIDGTLRKEGTGSILYSGTLAFNDGGKFELAGTNKYIPVATWHDNSTCEITGAIGGDMTATYHTDQEFGNFTWNCAGQTSNVYFSGALTNIDGDFTLTSTNSNEFRFTGSTGANTTTNIDGNVDIQNGTLNLTSGSNNWYMVCKGNYVQSGGIIKADGTGIGNLIFQGAPATGKTFLHSGGTFNPDKIQVNSSYELTLASDMNIGTAPTTVKGTLTVPTGYTFTIPSGGLLTLDNGNMTVEGTLTNSAGNPGLVIKSTATEQGSLIHSTADVDATVERQITQYSAGDDGWHLLSSPVNNFVIGSSDFEPTAGDDDLYSWDESTNYWINYHLDPGPGFAFSNFINGEGYLCAYKTTDTKIFDGKLNVADVTHTNLSADDVRWHLLGNPFSSAIEWGAGTWAVTDVGVPQIYKESDGNYYAVNTLSGDDATNIIPSTQGFVVRVVDNTNSITIPADARVHDGQDWYKNSKELENTLKLKLSGGDNTFCDYTLISFDDNATEEYDIEFDSYKFFGMPSAPQMYTLSTTQELFSYNNIPTPDGEKIIPLNISVPSDGEYTIDLALNNMVLEGNIYLEDLLTTQLVDLSEVTAYSFQASPQNNSNRFMLHFNGSAGLNENINSHQSSVLIYSNNNIINIKSLDDNSLSGTLQVSNIIGQIVYQEELNNGTQQTINTNLNTGIYIVSVKTENGYVISKKVIIK